MSVESLLCSAPLSVRLRTDVWEATDFCPSGNGMTVLACLPDRAGCDYFK